MSNAFRKAAPKVAVHALHLVLRKIQLRQTIFPLGPPFIGKTALAIQFLGCDREKKLDLGNARRRLPLVRLQVGLFESGLRAVKTPIRQTS